MAYSTPGKAGPEAALRGIAILDANRVSRDTFGPIADGPVPAPDGYTASITGGNLIVTGPPADSVTVTTSVGPITVTVHPAPSELDSRILAALAAAQAAQSAAAAINTELGADPSGAQTTVADRFAAMQTALDKVPAEPASLRHTVRTLTAAGTLTATDQTVRYDAAADAALTLPLGLPLGTVLRVVQVGAGAAVITPAGGVVLTPSNTPQATRGAGAQVDLRVAAVDGSVVDVVHLDEAALTDAEFATRTRAVPLATRTSSVATTLLPTDDVLRCDGTSPRDVTVPRNIQACIVTQVGSGPFRLVAATGAFLRGAAHNSPGQDLDVVVRLARIEASGTHVYDVRGGVAP